MIKMNEIVLEYKNKIDYELKNIYEEGPKLLLDPISHVFSGLGKRLRPLLTLFTTKAFKVDINKSLDAALAIEILHNFTLVHDDIMDKDKLRHGKQTLNSKWDNDIALLAGDAMLALALGKLANYSNNDLLFSTFTAGLLAVCEGQALDKEFETREKVGLSEYLEMIDLKTGYLIGLSAELGGIVSKVDRKQCLLLREFGKKIGRAFQIQDDMLEIFSDSKTMGKSLKSDFELEKKTFLMIKQEESNPGFIKEVSSIIKKDYQLGILKIRKILVDKGVYNESQKIIKSNIKEANEILNLLECDVQYLKYFSSLIEKRKS